MKRDFTDALRLVLRNGPVLVLGGLLFQFLLLVSVQLAQWILDQALEAAALPYLTPSTLGQLVRSPLSLLLLAALALLLALAVLVELTFFLCGLDCAARGVPTGLLALLKETGQAVARLIRFKNWMLLPMLLLLLPVLGPVFLPLGTLRLPGFLWSYLKESPALLAACLVVAAVLLLLCLRWIFALHSMALYGALLPAAGRRSALLLRGRRCSTVWRLAVWLLVLSLLAAGVYSIFVLFHFLQVKLAFSGAEARAVFWHRLFLLSASAKVLWSLLRGIGILALLTVLFRRYTSKAVYPVTQRGFLRRLPSIVGATVLLLFYVECIGLAPWSGVPSLEHMLVVAHRGGAELAPENTLSALGQAIESGADWAEVDVRATADGQLVLLHDESFRRTAGVDKNVAEVTLREARTYDLGRRFSARYAGERVPTLEEAILYAKDRLGLMIELKGNATELIESAVALVEQYGVQEQSILASMDQRVLEQVKALNPALHTVYISAVAYGDLLSLPAADGYSVEASFVTPMLCSSTRAEHRPLFAWTVNDAPTMRRLAGLELTGIVTDNPYLARTALVSGPLCLLYETLATHLN